jgi:hypothetical protein
LLNALYAVAIRDAFGTGAFFVATVLQAVTIAGSATFSCDTGCPPVALSTAGFLHTVFRLPYFAITCVAPFLAWRAFRGRDEWRALSTISLVMGVLLVGLFLMGPTLGADRVGLWHRLVLVPAHVASGRCASPLSGGSQLGRHSMTPGTVLIPRLGGIRFLLFIPLLLVGVVLFGRISGVTRKGNPAVTWESATRCRKQDRPPRPR